MTPVFVDTWYYLAVFNPKDPLHGMATSWSRRSRRPFVTTEYVLLELGNALSQTRTLGVISQG